jgi:gliotoxin/aspirochlorine biosynthesis aminotransferase
MATAILSDHAQVSGLVRTNTLWLRKAALLVMDFLSFHNITFSRPVGGLYIWVKLGGEHATWEQEARLYESCASAGVAIGCGIDYRADEAGWFRLSIALPQPTLFEALRRIEEGMGLKDAWQPLSKARPLSQKLLQWLKLRKYSALC